MKNEIIFPRLLIYITFILGIINVCVSENVKKSIDDNRDDTGEINDEAKDESLDIPVENESNNTVTCTRRANSQMHEIQSAQIKQFPFVVAVMSHQNEYLCAGSVISNGLILTTAKCTLQPISYVLLNTTRDKKDETTTMLHVIKTEKFPTFTGSDSLKDVGLIYTEKHNSSVASKIKVSNFTSARNIADVEAIGFGLNADVGQPKELQYIGLEQRLYADTGDLMVTYFDCIETKVPTCFKDTGGPVIFENLLIGIVVKGTDECTKEMSGTYAINKRIADCLPTYTFKAWLDERIKKNEEQEESELPTYPLQPAAARRTIHKMTASSARSIKSSIYILMVFYPILAIS
ncbi:chymotrypsinogen 2-like [Pectinophora gossypiella]|nr:chymotrypsinogen 2-like [Pectinophora gossypiella]